MFSLNNPNPKLEATGKHPQACPKPRFPNPLPRFPLAQHPELVGFLLDSILASSKSFWTDIGWGV